MPNLTVDAARALVVETLERCNTAPHNAQAVAEALVQAEMAGQAGHGLRRVPSYAGQALSGKVDGHAVPAATLRAPGALSVDAAHGFAYPAMNLALEQLPLMAASNGIAIAGIHRSHHCGVAGVTVERLARDGLVALMFANTPAAMAPWGGNKALFGTNPIAFGAPAGPDGPIVIDLSLSKVARGKILAAQQKGDSIPEGWAIGPDGVPTTDPDTALQGTMVPLGDAKGTALALMVELMAAALTGAAFASDAGSFFTAEGDPPGTGQCIIAIKPEVIGGEDTPGRFEAMALAIEEQPGARVPGRSRQRIRQEILSKGIEVDDDLLARISDLGR